MVTSVNDKEKYKSQSGTDRTQTLKDSNRESGQGTSFKTRPKQEDKSRLRLQDKTQAGRQVKAQASRQDLSNRDE